MIKANLKNIEKALNGLDWIRKLIDFSHLNWINGVYVVLYMFLLCFLHVFLMLKQKYKACHLQKN